MDLGGHELADRFGEIAPVAPQDFGKLDEPRPQTDEGRVVSDDCGLLGVSRAKCGLMMRGPMRGNSPRSARLRNGPCARMDPIARTTAFETMASQGEGPVGAEKTS